MQDVSETLVASLFAEQEEDVALLLTLNADGLDEPLRVTTENGGLTSNGNPFEFFPFGFGWGGASRDEPVRDATLEIGNVDGRIAQAIRTAVGLPTVTVQLVRVAAPDAIEIAMIDAPLVDAEVDDPKVTATIRPRNFQDEPAVAARYTLARTPALA